MKPLIITSIGKDSGTGGRMLMVGVCTGMEKGRSREHSWGEVV